MIHKIDKIQVILMLEETLKYDWVQHLKILTPPDDNSWIYVRADGLLPQQVNELLEICIAGVQRYNTVIFCRGLWIYIDGQNWLGSYADCESCFEDCFFYLSRILNLGETSEASVCLTEGYTLVMKRVSDRLTLSAYPGDSIAVNLWDFTRHLLEAGEVYLQLIEKLRALIKAYEKPKNVHAELTRIVEVLDRVETVHIRACLDEFRSELVKRASTQG
ncbi:hypothetical protein IFO70_17185 [Phormidium tenue FACHB-886]|nr:hypothetical protein [Phormidium tenue FACHB-886]